MNDTKSSAVDTYRVLFYNSSIVCTVLSVIALFVNLYLLNCSRYLRRPIGVNLRLCVSLTASDALAAFCYILTYSVNIFLAETNISNCWSLLLEVIKLATFFASVSTLLILALNHYVGIVYPLRRHVITKRSVRITILLSYVVPFGVFFLLFCIVPGGFRADVAFGFLDSRGCASTKILQNPIVRSVIVVPFIVFTLAVSFLYCHIMIHMSRSTRDPLIANNTNKRKYNAKLLGTLAMLAGSAVIVLQLFHDQEETNTAFALKYVEITLISTTLLVTYAFIRNPIKSNVSSNLKAYGWLPTTVLFALICSECVFPVNGPLVMYLTILSHLLNILKLIFDAFIYASRLIDIRFAMWEFHNVVLSSFNSIFKTGSLPRHVPSEFSKYLSDNSRSGKTRRLRNTISTPTSSTHKQRTKSPLLRDRCDTSERCIESLNPEPCKGSICIVSCHHDSHTAQDL